MSDSGGSLPQRVRRELERHPLSRSLYHRLAPILYSNTVETVTIGSSSIELSVETPHESRRVANLGGEQDAIETILESVQRGDVVFDVGANIGTHTCLFADRVGDEGLVVAVEPDEANVAALHRNVRLNDFDDRVAVAPYACSAERGFATLHRGGLMAGTGTHSLDSARAGAGLGALETVTVPVVTLDGLASLFGSPGVIKIDVEGAESDVIEGGERSVEGARDVFVEEHDSAELSGEVLTDRGDARIVRL